MERKEVMELLLRKHDMKQGIVIHCLHENHVDYSITSEGIGHGAKSALRLATYDMLEALREHKVTITFDRESHTHNLKMENVTGKELLIAHQSLTMGIEKELGMPIGLAMMRGLEEYEALDDKVNNE